MTSPNCFPYPYRPGQEDIVRLVRASVHDGQQLVLESGTGTGKTVVSLCAALEGCTDSRRKVIFLTRTKSQQRQIALEARAISSKMDVMCVSMQGRGPTTCPMIENKREFAGGTSEELSKMCSVLKKGNTDAGSCPYFNNLDSDRVEACVSFLRSVHPDPEEFREFCSAAGICPYEASKRMLQYADVVSAPYAFFFIPAIRGHFLEWMGVGERDVVLIVDEAHNLPSYLRDIQTYRVTRHSLDLTMSEADDEGDPEVYSGISVRDIVTLMQEVLRDAQINYLKRDNDLIPSGYLQEELMVRLGMTTFDIRNMLANMVGVGEAVADGKRLNRRLPRSHILTLARFLLNWISCDESSHVYLVSGGDNPALEAYCLDPRDASDVLSQCHSTISMSGTLSPLPYYAQELDLFNPVLSERPSPFPRSNLKVGYVRDVSTKYDEINGEDGTYDRLVDYVIRLVNSVKKNTAVFFPSYSLMQRFIDDNVPAILNREIYYERSDMPQSELMEQTMDFRCSPGSVLFAVSGGRISEGLDFPGKELELAIIVGIPYGRPSAKQDSLIRYCQCRFGDGWNMAVKVPAVRKMRQAIGRLIRSETDRGIAIILDRRVAMMSEIDAEYMVDPVSEVQRFFSSS
ncbi:MAG: ATP-dependent DNA helicase [archaeon]|nr:ATP-dependent DNA helicase [archaeon]